MNDLRNAWLRREPLTDLSRTLTKVAWALTAVVLILVALMRQVKIPLPEGVSFAFLPPFHAGVNAVAAVVLIGALVAVKRGDIALHRKLIMAAMGLSVLFLLSYVAYHFTSGEVIYGDADGDGVLSPDERLAVAGTRGYYLVLLISHIVLAGVSLPFILFTFISGFTNRFAAHRRLARWVFPAWLYVAVTGPICYWMLRPYYGA